MFSPPRRKIGGGTAPYKPQSPSPLNPNRDRTATTAASATTVCGPWRKQSKSPRKAISITEALLRTKAEDAWQEHQASQNAEWWPRQPDWDENEADEVPDLWDKEFWSDADVDDVLLKLIDLDIAEELLYEEPADGNDGDCQHTDTCACAVKPSPGPAALVSQDIGTFRQRDRDANEVEAERGDTQCQTQGQPGTQMSPTQEGFPHSSPQNSLQTDAGGDTSCGGGGGASFLRVESLLPEYRSSKGLSMKIRLGTLVAHLEIPRPRQLLALAALSALAYSALRFRIFDHQP